ncbi:MAG TPA: rod shape-determining protein MreC [Treponema sp.]|nr:rod shape-determining protein MreC [Treponema sp.]
MLFLSTRSFIVNFRELGLSAFSGARGAVHSVYSFFDRSFDSIRELADLRRQYDALALRLQRFEELQRDSADIRKENFKLRELLGFSTTTIVKHTPAEIIGKDPDNLFSAYLVNKGSKHGLKKNMPVIAFQDGNQGLVGKIVQVGLTESLMMPVFDGNSFAAVRFDESRYEGIAEGEGSQDKPLLVRYIKKRAKDELKFGDIVSTSGLGGVYPKDIMVGRVSKILVQEYQTSIEVELEPIIDFSRLEYVFVIENAAEGVANVR